MTTTTERKRSIINGYYPTKKQQVYFFINDYLKNTSHRYREFVEFPTQFLVSVQYDTPEEVQNFIEEFKKNASPDGIRAALMLMGYMYQYEFPTHPRVNLGKLCLAGEDMITENGNEVSHPIDEVFDGKFSKVKKYQDRAQRQFYRYKEGTLIYTILYSNMDGFKDAFPFFTKVMRNYFHDPKKRRYQGGALKLIDIFDKEITDDFKWKLYDIMDRFMMIAERR